MPAPYYADELVTLFHGKCEDITEWLAADVLVTDPPYGRGWKQGTIRGHGTAERGHHAGHEGIASDEDTGLRDWVLSAWGNRLAIVFGDLTLAPAPGTKQTLVFGKPSNAGLRGAMGGFRRDAEAIYLVGPWPSGLGGRSSILVTGATKYGSGGPSDRYGHPHAKPVDVMEDLIRACPPGTIADPTAGAGSTLVAARNLGRQAIGVELEEKYCERAANRLSQMVLEIA